MCFLMAHWTHATLQSAGPTSGKPTAACKRHTRVTVQLLHALQMGRFDEQATYEKEKAAETGGVGGSTAPNAQMSDMSVNEQPVSNRSALRQCLFLCSRLHSFWSLPRSPVP
jgi:hypothetical protein